jgi:hypothetical protein
MSLHKIFLVFLIAMSAAVAAPGAHGPNGEHLDGHESGDVHRNAEPRIESFTEIFELVGHLEQDELSILIDRYDTNEPVLNGKLEVEFNGIKAPAKFHADHGDYAVDDANLLKALAKPGKHALVFTFSAGNDNDLLEGTLDVSAHNGTHDHDHSLTQKGAWLAGVALVAIVIAAFAASRRRNKLSGKKS